MFSLASSAVRHKNYTNFTRFNFPFDLVAPLTSFCSHAQQRAKRSIGRILFTFKNRGLPRTAGVFVWYADVVESIKQNKEKISRLRFEQESQGV